MQKNTNIQTLAAKVLATANELKALGRWPLSGSDYLWDEIERRYNQECLTLLDALRIEAKSPKAEHLSVIVGSEVLTCEVPPRPDKIYPAWVYIRLSRLA
jgi:hypothetical protein